MQVRKLLKQDYQNWLSLWEGYQNFSLYTTKIDNSLK